MNNKTLQIVCCLTLIFHGRSLIAKPVNPEDVEGLLPPTPRDKNETMAQVVQDPVIQDAVNHAVNNGSLNALVVKKHVFIMPATNPDLVLTKREHLLVVPTENLEDVRKNITESKTEEASTLKPAFFVEYASEYTPEENENADKTKRESSSEDNVDQAKSLDEKRKSETEFLENTLRNGDPIQEDSSSKKIAVPIVAVIDPSKTAEGKAKSPIVAILPNEHQVSNDALGSQIQFIQDKSKDIQKEAQNYIDRNSVTVNADYWKSTPSVITVALSSTQGNSPISLYAPQVPAGLVTEQTFLPQWRNVFAVSSQEDQQNYPRETGDMDVAEDIIFRPLFRYRQQNNRRYSYSNYDSYYPRRASFYRTRY